jgi:hypothetical protein
MEVADALVTNQNRERDMNVEELSRLVTTWPDALTLAEVVSNPFLRVGERWDLHDWQAVETPSGLQFEHIDDQGRVLEAVLLIEPDVETESMKVPESFAKSSFFGCVAKTAPLDLPPLSK